MSERLNVMLEFYRDNDRMIETAERINDSYLEMLDALEVLEAENAKLRKLVALWMVIDKHMSLCATTDCRQCPVREECEESVYLEGLLGIDSKELSWRVQERMSESGKEVDV